MRKTKHKRKAEFLKAVCSDAGVCIAFGTFNEEIKKFFGGFTNFVYAVAPIKRVGKISVNGFVHEITYMHRGYQAQAILKSSATYYTDNLMYEYMVGKYVNKLNRRFPCFLETYGYYIYNDHNDWNKMKTTQTLASTDILKQGLTLQKTIDYATGCEQSQYLSILIQHLKGIISMRDSLKDLNFVNNELPYALFQIYSVLALMKNNFTHYDLHGENVFMYEPSTDKYIEYHYYINSKVVSFKCKYIAKIIDYGHAFFNDTEEKINTTQVYNALCATKKCNYHGKCGKNQGFQFITGVQQYFITSQTPNISHDLRLLDDVKYIVNHIPKTTVFLKDLINKVEYGVGISKKGDKPFGTKENKKSGLPGKISNVDDAYLALLEYITASGMKAKNDVFYMLNTKLGDLHIYDDGRPMRFVKA